MECVICYEQNSVENQLMVISCCSKHIHDECLIKSNTDKCVMCRSPLFVTLPLRYAEEIERVRKMEISISDFKRALDLQSQYRLEMFVNSVRHVAPDILFENEYILTTLIGVCDPNYTIGKELNSLIHYAACVSQRTVVELIKRGANINSKNAYNSTPLTYSLSKQKWDLATKLIEHGAIVHNKALFIAINKNVPGFLLGILLNKVTSMKALYVNKNVHIVHILITKKDEHRLRLALDAAVVKTLIRLQGAAILIYTIKYKCDVMVPVLLEAGVPVTSAAISAAVTASTARETVRLMLLKFQTVRDLYTDAANTVLHCIIRKSDEELLKVALTVPIVRELLQTEENYLEYAIMHGSYSTGRALIESGLKNIGSGIDVANRLHVMRVTEPEFVDMLCCEARMSSSMFENLCSCVTDKYKCAIALMQDTGRINSVSVIKKLNALTLDYNTIIDGRVLESYTTNKRIRDFIVSQKN